MKYLIFNFNMAEDTDKIYSKLLFDGVDFNDIYIVDNGSEYIERHPKTKIQIGKNNFLPSAMRVAFNIMLDKYPMENYVSITTSAKLLDDVNYKDCIESSVEKIPSSMRDVFCLTATYIFENKNKLLSDIMYRGTGKLILYPYLPQFVMSVMSYGAIMFQKGNSIGFYNKDCLRGHGCDLELTYALSCENKWILSSDGLPVIWKINNTHVMGKATENVRSYHTKARKEYQASFALKYGVFWEMKFYLKRLHRILIVNVNMWCNIRKSKIVDARYMFSMTMSFFIQFIKDKL